jgi:hypothetical protein
MGADLAAVVLRLLPPGCDAMDHGAVNRADLNFRCASANRPRYSDFAGESACINGISRVLARVHARSARTFCARLKTGCFAASRYDI